MPIRVAQIMGKMENGGVEAVVMNYYRHIDRNKVQFDFIVDSDSSCPQEDEIKSLGGRVIRIAPYQKITANMRDLRRIFKQNKYKIVHAELTTMSVFSLAVAASCGISIRIAHSHSTIGKGEKKKNIMKYILRPFSKVFATHYFACSDYAGKWLFGKNIGKSKRYKVIPNAIDTKKFRFDQTVRDEVRKELGIEGKFVVGHIGRFCFAKNHDFLIDIFYEVHKKRPDSVLILIGEGELLESVKQKVHRLILDQSVKFLSVRNDVYRLYQAFDVFVLPSRYEGFGLVALEAQFSGLPTILSDKVPEEVIITNNVKYCALENSSTEWADIVLNATYKNRKIQTESMKYNIREQAKKLGKIYLTL